MKKKEEEWEKLSWKWRKVKNGIAGNETAPSRITAERGRSVTIWHENSDMCASIVAFPYTGCSPLILPRCKYERSSCRGEPHFAIERTSQPSDHQPSLPCLAYPPTHLYTRPHIHAHRDVYMNTCIHMYIYTYTEAGWESTSTDIKPIPCFHAALHCLSRAGWDPPWKEASRWCAHTRDSTRYAHTSVHVTRINVHQGVYESCHPIYKVDSSSKEREITILNKYLTFL